MAGGINNPTHWTTEKLLVDNHYGRRCSGNWTKDFGKKVKWNERAELHWKWADAFEMKCNLDSYRGERNGQPALTWIVKQL